MENSPRWSAEGGPKKERREKEPEPKLGDYAEGVVVGGAAGETRKGTIVQIRPDGTYVLRSGIRVCENPDDPPKFQESVCKNIKVIPDGALLPETLEEVQINRKDLKETKKLIEEIREENQKLEKED